jgi:hypothetical protein
MNAARVALADVGGRALAAAAAVEIGLALLVRPGEIGSPLGGILVPWPLVSCLAPLALLGLWHAPMTPIERTSARGAAPPLAIRLAAAAALVGAATLVVAVASPSDASPVAGDGMAAWRNAALIGGVTLASAAWLPPALAWVPGTGYVLACAAVGVPAGGEPYDWMVILQPPDDGTAAVIGFAVLACGLLVALAGVRRRTG